MKYWERVDWRKNWERELQKPLCVEINRKEFEELTRDIYNGRHNNDFKIIMQKTLWSEKCKKKKKKKKIGWN